MSGPRPKEPVSTEELFRSHAPFVARFLYRFGVSTDDLDDAVQEVFLVVHRNGGYTPGPATPTSYLASIAVRAAASHRRRGRTNRERRAELEPDQVPSAAGSPVQVLETRESLTQIQSALEELEPSLRATLVLVELEGETCKSIAASLRIPVGTVYWRLHRARKTFRLAVEAHQTDVGEARLGGERRMEEMAARGILFWRSKSPADVLLEAARQQPPVHYDATTALLRHQELVRSGAHLPSWAGSAVAAATTSAGVALTAPVVVSAIVAVSAIGGGVAWRHAAKKNAAAVSPAMLIMASAAEGRAPEVANRVPQQASSSDPVAIAQMLPTPAPSESAPSLTAPFWQPAKNDPTEKVGAVPEATLPSPARFASGPVMQMPPSPDARLAEAQPAPPERSGSQPIQDARGLAEIAEVREVATAEQLLTTAPARALSLVRSGEARFVNGYLREERRYIGVIALFKLGRVDEARVEAARFLSDYPDGPYSERVRGAVLRANVKG
jgi:RNA polymerase sigma-70 factor (ECF subfamily)